MTRSGRSMTSSGSTRTISMRLRRRLRLVEDIQVVDFRAAADMVAVRTQEDAAVRRRFRSTLRGLIFRTFKGVAVPISRSRAEDLAGASGTSSVECLRETVARGGLSREPILSTK